MHIMTQVYQIGVCFSILKDDFKSIRKKWKPFGEENGLFSFTEGVCNIKSLAHSDFCGLQTKTPMSLDGDFVIDATVCLRSNSLKGHFGLTWGNPKPENSYNTFTISADLERCLLRTRDFDGEGSLFRSQKKIRPRMRNGQSLRFSMVRLGAYCYFLINGKIVDIVGISHFVWDGPFFGFVVNGGLQMSCESVELKKIHSKEEESIAGLGLLLG